MARALDLTRYFLAHGRAAFGMMTRNEAAARALKLWASITRMADDGGTINLRDLTRAVARRGRAFEKSEDVLAAVGTLEAHDYLRQHEVVVRGERSVTLLVNPAAMNASSGRTGDNDA